MRIRCRHDSFGSGGSALITSLLASVILMILVTALLSTRVSELHAICGTVRATNAQHVSEAGVDYVLGMVIEDSLTLPALDANGNFYDVTGSFAGGTFAAVADLDPDTGTFRVVSTGVAPGDTQRTVEVLYDIATMNRIVDDYGLFTCGDLTLEGSAQVVNGDVYTGGNLDIGRQDAVSNGDITARGNITFVSGEGSVTGNAWSETGTVSISAGNATRQRVGGNVVNPTGLQTLTDPQVFGEIEQGSLEELYLHYCDESTEQYQTEIAVDFDSYLDEVDQVGDAFNGDMHITSGTTNGYAFQHYIDGNALIEGTPPGMAFDGGIYYITGSLTVKGNFSGSATFVVLGDLIIEGSSESGSDVDRAYVVGGNVTMAGGSVVDGLIYTEGDISASGDATVNGGVVALGSGGVTGSHTVNAEDTGNVNLTNATIPDFRVQRWRLISD